VPDLEVLPPALDGESGVRLSQELRPDVVLMDLDLPVLDGILAIRSIMSTAPCPIVVLSAYLDSPERDRTFESLQAGAVDVLAKPRGIDAEAVTRFSDRLIRTVRLMSQARVVRRSPPPLPGSAPAPHLELGLYDVVVIGSSTGGPVVLYDLLSRLPAPYPLPIAIGQHIVPGFEHGLAQWLSGTGHRVSVASPGRSLTKGQVVLAPADQDLLLGRDGMEVAATRAPPTPSVDVLFRSAADTFGNRVIGVLLTGMGEDGARGLLELRRAGSLTITQSAATCIVDGMPRAARARDAGILDLPPTEIADLLRTISVGHAPKVSTHREKPGRTAT
jgi:two-component system chemotaxis response regulator CheB